LRRAYRRTGLRYFAKRASLIQQVNQEFGTTILMITHNSAIARMAHADLK
jgi:ABC-type lipoprotein export system ATPase subunit